jgi:putative heme-binding domain-containing protein
MRGDRIDMLLTKVESQEIPSGFVEPSTIQRLMTSGDQGIRDRASKLWAPPSGPERDALVAKYKAALSADPQPARGKAVFQKNCAQCHKIDTLGVNVGPDISDLRTKSHEQVLLDILEPNRAIDANFVGYSCATTDGRTLTGILTSETSSAITIKQQQGVIVTLAREEVEEIIPTGKSLMPEGIERVISPSEMADVVYFVKEWRYLDGRIPKP